MSHQPFAPRPPFSPACWVAAALAFALHLDDPLRGFSPLSGLPTFYGLGWNVNYDEQGRLRLGHSGAFALGAATTVLLVPSEQLGIVVLTNAYPIGVAEGVEFSVEAL